MADDKISDSSIRTHKMGSQSRPSRLQLIYWRLQRRVSRFTGCISRIPIPSFLRGPLTKVFILVFGVDPYTLEGPAPSLAKFFNRPLLREIPVHPQYQLVSPVDGRVACILKNQKNVQVKSSDITLPEGVTASPTNPMKHSNNSMYIMVIYLSPSDYHGVHSPTRFNVCSRNHYRGALGGVKPQLNKVGIPTYVKQNERVAYNGSWAHGFFSLTFIGAFNVGSIKVDNDPSLTTNTRRGDKYLGTETAPFDIKFSVPPREVFGRFELGSSVMLYFEAPSDYFEFNVELGQKVTVGQPLARTTM